MEEKGQANNNLSSSALTFSSENIASTKANTEQRYFVNVVKPSLFQKIRNKFDLKNYQQEQERLENEAKERARLAAEAEERRKKALTPVALNNPVHASSVPQKPEPIPEPILPEPQPTPQPIIEPQDIQPRNEQLIEKSEPGRTTLILITIIASAILGTFLTVGVYFAFLRNI